MNNTPTNETSSKTWIKSTCAYCGVGCGIEAHVDNSGKVNVRGDTSHPANYGRLCSKGLALGDTVTNEGRLNSPIVNNEPTQWNKALDLVAEKFAATIKKHGPDSVAFYVSGQLLTEDYYVANKLMKGYIGSANIDTNSRLCMSSSVAGHKRAFGSDTVPNCYEDLELADMVILTGSNLAWCHPVLYQRLKAAKQQKPEMKIVVIDPRETDTCEIADLHLAIKPGTDVALFNGLLNHLNEEGVVNTHYINAHTEGFADALKTAQEDTGSGSDSVDYLQTSHLTGVPIPYLETFYQWFADHEKVVTAYSQGVNQSSSGTDKVNSIINCHLATGRIGLPGAGPFSITGQPNAMGGREVGGLANMLAAHMEFGNTDHHRIVSEFWDTQNLATQPGLKAVELFDAVAEGKIKAIWIMATNPVVSMPNANKVKQALQDCPFVVVSDCIADTDTTRCADVLLPAMGWAEKSGTVTNSERRISRQRRLIATSNDQLTQPKADWWIMSQVALRMGYAGFNFTSEADVFSEFAAMTGFHNNGSRDLDISALADLSKVDYDALGPQQWPLPSGQKVDAFSIADNADHSQLPPQRRFFADGQFYTPSKKAQFINARYRSPMTVVSKAAPMVLNSGRIRDQWHTMTRTGLANQLGGHKPEPYVQINPQDARCFNLKQGDIAELSNAWGSAKARVELSTQMNPGQLFMPIHWTDVESSHGKVCTLVSPDVDPVSAQPEAKFTPVAIRSWAINCEAIVLCKSALDTSRFDYWVRRRVPNGFIYYIAQAAIENSSETNLLGDVIQQVLTQPSDTAPSTTKESLGTTIAFDDKAKQQFRHAAVLNGELQHVIIVGPRLADGDYAWLDDLFSRELNVDIQRSILSGQPAPSMVSGKQVCACKQVGELTIIDAIEQQQCTTVEALGECTGAGTGCGSCIPEVAKILADNAPTAIAVAV